MPANRSLNSVSRFPTKKPRKKGISVVIIPAQSILAPLVKPKIRAGSAGTTIKLYSANPATSTSSPYADATARNGPGLMLHATTQKARMDTQKICWVGNSAEKANVKETAIAIFAIVRIPPRRSIAGTSLIFSCDPERNNSRPIKHVVEEAENRAVVIPPTFSASGAKE